MHILEVKELVRDYSIISEDKKERTQIHVLKGLDFSVESGEFVGVMGKSGCGKTTLLKTLGLIHRPTSGSVWLEGEDTGKLPEEKRADIRNRKIGFIFQDFYLMNSLSVEENIMLPMMIAKSAPEEMRKRAAAYATQFEIAHLLKKYPYELSGGERQRVAICRALMNEPELILADEPTGNLDSRTSREVMALMQQVVREQKKTLVMVTHDDHLAGYADRIFHIIDGKIVKVEDNRKKAGEHAEQGGNEQ